MAAAQQMRQPDEAFADTSDTVEMSESDAVAQATTSGDGEPFGAKDIRCHPFVRLPAVNLEDVHLRYNGALVLSFDLGVTTPMEAYMKMRSLFAKDSLTAEDVSTLMVNADYLAKYAVAKLARPCRKCTAGHLLMRLSALFMAFDYLVCTIKLLGDHMDAGSWWPAFVQRFRTDYFFPEDSRRPKSKILNNLVNRLSAALSIYKQARRPALEEVIELKRAILNHASKDSQLANPLWKLWIEDDKQFSPSSGHVESPSDVQARSQEDPKHS
ncbi:uncharacterized protein EMH_0100160 [Eimeria mitis]|uniref:Uncharacterized protein n=1 Tax=Eimeria mitis TaxID=44415 RepID=U6KCF8_9EIME|nr:uncharacterized protein EMH_0100160 [Eimeria mitis]CDJ35715.1 hypothetical protein EMH_0100160 [Eimeria mitis]